MPASTASFRTESPLLLQARSEESLFLPPAIQLSRVQLLGLPSFSSASSLARPFSRKVPPQSSSAVGQFSSGRSLRSAGATLSACFIPPPSPPFASLPF